MGERLLTGLWVLASSTIAGLLGYGTYGYFHDKKKMSSWKAGAATGAITGTAAMVLVLAGQYPGVGGLLGAIGTPRGLPRGYRRPGMGAVVLQQLRGCPSCR